MLLVAMAMLIAVAASCRTEPTIVERDGVKYTERTRKLLGMPLYTTQDPVKTRLEIIDEGTQSDLTWGSRLWYDYSCTIKIMKR